MFGVRCLGNCELSNLQKLADHTCVFPCSAVRVLLRSPELVHLVKATVRFSPVADCAGESSHNRNLTKKSVAFAGRRRGFITASWSGASLRVEMGDAAACGDYVDLKTARSSPKPRRHVTFPLPRPLRLAVSCVVVIFAMDL